jgi:hypothetical protein
MTTRKAWVVLACLAAAVAYGAGASWIPAPADGSFWLGNTSAPYLVLPFLAGAATPTLGRAATALLGVAVDWAMVAAFYARSLYDPAQLANSRRLGQHPFSPQHLRHWTIGLYTVNGRWIVLGVLAGVTFAVLGRAWRRTGSPLLAAAAAAVLAAEPAAHWIDTSFRIMPVAASIGEIGCGGLLLAILLLMGRRIRTPARSARLST